MLKFAAAVAMILLPACATAGDVASGSMTSADAAEPEHLAFEHFIERRDARLYDGDKEFRFLSVNIPTLWYIEDDWSFGRSNPYRLPTEFEIRDVLGAARQLGGNVVRAYTVPVRNVNYPADSVTFVEAPGVFNEEAFRTMDLAIAIAAEYKIRLVVPLVNNWEWHGGRPNYAAFRGMEGDAFCTDPQLRADFKETIKFVTTRVNTITGVPYNQDPTIMAFETGNEMTCPGEWAVDIARTIKSYAPNQLVVDGRHSVHMIYQGEIIRDFPQQYAIDEPAIDLISTHHYEEDPAAMVRNLRDTIDLVGGSKPVFLGEFGFMSPPAMRRVYDFVIENPDIVGGMIWSLRRHHKDGGWLHHSEPLGAGLYRAYHWPGFDDGEPFGERAFLQLLREKAYEIRGLELTQLPPPPPPELLPIENVGSISWRGSLGASSYTIERASDLEGPWEEVGNGIDDIVTPGFPLFSDTSVELGEAYYYRVIAHNAAGRSDPSSVAGPVVPEIKTLVDPARSFGVAARWSNITISSGDFASYKEAYSRLSGNAGSELVYTVPGAIRELRIYAYEADDTPAISAAFADVEQQWEPAVTKTTDHEQHRGRVPRLYRVNPPGTGSFDYTQLAFNAASEIVRVEVDYVDH